MAKVTKNVIRVAMQGVQDAVRQHNELGKVGDKNYKKIGSSAKKARKNTRRFSAATKEAGGHLKALSAVATTYVGIRTAQSFLDASKTAEDYNIRLKVMLQSQEKANKLFQDLTVFAGKVPFEFEQIMGAATQLAAVVNKDANEINKYIPLIADVAAASGIGIEKTAEQFRRAMSAGINSADLFREKGVKAMFGFSEGAKVSAEETRRVFEASLGDTTKVFYGATDELAKSWTGITSMLSDKWFLFRINVMDSAPFDYLKASFTEINDSFGQNAEEMKANAEVIGQSVVDTAEVIILGTASLMDAVAPAVRLAGSAVDDMIDGYNNLPSWLQDVGVVGALVLGKKGVMVLAGLSYAHEQLRKFKAEVIAVGLATQQLHEEGVKPPTGGDYNDEDMAEYRAVRDARAAFIRKDMAEIGQAIADEEDRQRKDALKTLDITTTSYRDRAEIWIDSIKETVDSTRMSAEMEEKLAAGRENQAKATGIAAEKVNEYSASLVELRDNLTREFQLVKLTGKAHEDLKIKIKAEENARKAVNAIMKDTQKSRETVIELYGEEIAEIEALTTAIAEQKRTADENAKQLENSLQPFIHAGEEAQDMMADVFREWQDGGISSFENISDKAVDIIKNMAAEMAAAMVFKPLIAPIAASAAGFVLGDGAEQSALQQFGISSGEGGSGFGGVGNILSAGKSLFSGGNLLFNSNAGFGAFDAAQSLGLGIDASQNIANAAGSLGSLGGIAGGFAGNFGANAIFGGDRGVGADIGGTLGAIAGSFIPVPILGPLIGSFIGNAIGGLFGGGVGTVASEFEGITGADGLENIGVGSKRSDTKFATAVSDSVSAIVAGLNDLELGLADQKIRGGLNTKQHGGGFLEFNGEYIKFNAESEEGLSEALAELTVQMTRTSDVLNDDLVTALENIETEGRSVEEVLGDIEFASNFEKLGEAPEIITQTAAAMAALDERFEELADTADRLGLSVEKVNDAKIELTQDIVDGFDADLDKALLEIISPVTNRVQEINDYYNALQAEAADLGEKDAQRSLKIEQLRSLALAEAKGTIDDLANVANDWSRVSDSIANTIQGYTYGSSSSLSIVDQNAQAKAEFYALAHDALINSDAKTATEAIEMAGIFRSTSREINASSAAFKAEDLAIQEQLLALQSLADKQTDMALQVQQSQLSELIGIKELLGNPLFAANDNTHLLRDGQDASVLDIISPITGLLRGVEKQIKYSVAGFDFSAAGNQNRSFQQALDGLTNSAAIALAVNEAFVAQGGKAQDFGYGTAAQFMEHRASGGMVQAGRPYIINEANRQEVFVPSTNGQIIPPDKLGGNDEVVRVLETKLSVLIDQNTQIINDNKQIRNQNNKLLARRAR